MSGSDKGVKPGREQEREQGSATVKEIEKKDQVCDDRRPPAEEARRTTKEEKKRSEPERRVRNKDRPDRAFYQPRSVGRGSPRGDTPKTTETTAGKHLFFKNFIERYEPDLRSSNFIIQ